MLEKQSGVYAIVCKVNGHRYIGSSKDIRQRWNVHRSTLRRNESPCLALQNAWNKYGEDAFEHLILERVPIHTDLIIVEQHYMDTLHPEYNLRLVAESRLGMKSRPESVAKMKASITGLTRTAEQRTHIGDGLRGLTRTPEQVENIRRAATNPPEAQRQKMRAAKSGKTPTKAIEASVKARTGKARSQETIDKIRKTKLASFQKRREQGLPTWVEQDEQGRFKKKHTP